METSKKLMSQLKKSGRSEEKLGHFEKKRSLSRKKKSKFEEKNLDQPVSNFRDMKKFHTLITIENLFSQACIFDILSL